MTSSRRPPSARSTTRQRHLLRVCLLAGALAGGWSCTSTPRAPHLAPQIPSAFDADRLAAIHPLIEQAIEKRLLPGAIVVVGTSNRVVFKEVFGNRALEPEREPMTSDTVFDLASLTKVVATTPVVLSLVEQGLMGLDDSIAQHLPEVRRYGKERIRVRHLLTHTSGLRAGLDLADTFESRETALHRIAEEVPEAPPGERFIYSDLNFVLLGELVERVGGAPLDRLAWERVFAPLRMSDTGFRPAPELRSRVAPTEICTAAAGPCGDEGEGMLRGVVHDPTARRMGGVSGHAGLFGTADDLARFCRMMLNLGALDGVRVLSPLSVQLMTRTATAPGMTAVRALGWDVDSPFSVPRGDLYPVGSFGHTGWTGTSVWLDPLTGTFLILLSNRVHPAGDGDVRQLRGRLASIVASAIAPAVLPPDVRQVGAHVAPPVGVAPKPRVVQVSTGIDVLAADGFGLVRGLRLGLLTNHTGVTTTGARTSDVLHRAPGVKLAALFSPEHGPAGQADEAVASTVDAVTGLPIHSLYTDAHRRPEAAMLAGLDAVVIDLQDIGTRFYTYITSMAYLMEAAAQRGVKVVVLDRPNPINGFTIEGPIQEEEARGFTGYFPMPVRHGLTIGELARLFNAEQEIDADLIVVPMRGWARDRWYDETGLAWIGPSPSMRNMHQAVLYPGIGAIEWSNISVGRGTDSPFEQIGAPWIDGRRLAARLNERALPGVRFYPVAFTPTSSAYAGERCEGVFMIVTDRGALRPVRLGLEIAAALFELHGDRYETGETWKLMGSRADLEAIRLGADPEVVSDGWRAGEARWRRLWAKYLMYRPN